MPAMAELFLVRHAQAAFGTDDYDRLTDLGHRQARWLGEYFRDRIPGFDRVFTGTLRRHRETLEGILLGGCRVATAQEDARLDEYDPERLVRAHLAAIEGERSELPGAVTDTPEDGRKRHFRLLREALTAWTDGRVDATVHRPFTEFQEGAYQAFRSACSAQAGMPERVLVVSSGGPIASILAHHLEMPASSFVALNLQVRNSGFCELRFNAVAAQVVSFNNVPHLDMPERRRYITFS
jgi:broad specificity phosphatase PhoE